MLLWKGKVIFQQKLPFKYKESWKCTNKLYMRLHKINSFCNSLYSNEISKALKLIFHLLVIVAVVVGGGGGCVCLCVCICVCWHMCTCMNIHVCIHVHTPVHFMASIWWSEDTFVESLLLSFLWRFKESYSSWWVCVASISSTQLSHLPALSYLLWNYFSCD